MPQKLIRLTSDSGDGVFNGTFNEDIIIPENSEIALQSLTLERRSNEFFLNNTNNTANFQAVGDAAVDTPPNTATIQPLGVYNNQNDVSLLDAIQNAFNRASSMLTTPKSMNIQYKVSQNNAGLVEIDAKPSPFFPITATAALGTTTYYNLESGGNWTQNTPTANVTFDTTDLGIATYRQLGGSGGGSRWWIPEAGSSTKWDYYSIKPEVPGAIKSGYGEITSIDPGSFSMRINGGGQTLVPATTPVTFEEGAEPLSFIVNRRPVDNGVADAEELKIARYQVGEYGAFRETTTTSTNIAECYMYGAVPMIKSTGSFRARFRRLNTTGQDSAIMGIVKGSQGLEKLKNSTFSDDDLEYAIKIRGQTQAIQYKIKGGIYTDSTATPINHVVANPLGRNDVFEICLDNGDFLGIVNQNSIVGGTGNDNTKTMPRQPFDVSEDYYFVLCILENKNEIVLDNISVSLDPYLNLRNPQSSGAIARLTDTYLPTTHSNLISLIQYYSGVASSNVTDFNNGRINFTDNLFASFPKIGNQSLANFLGFGSIILSPQGGGSVYEVIEPTNVANKSITGLRQDYELQNGWRYTARKVYDLATFPQNILVETQTFTLDSYDSYGLQSQQRGASGGGSRRNILATIPSDATPIAGTANSLLQFEPATLNYIAIKNRGAITTRQLRFRLLSSTYDNIIVENMAAMVLLVRSY